MQTNVMCYYEIIANDGKWVEARITRKSTQVSIKLRKENSWLPCLRFLQTNFNPSASRNKIFYNLARVIMFDINYKYKSVDSSYNRWKMIPNKWFLVRTFFICIMLGKQLMDNSKLVPYNSFEGRNMIHYGHLGTAPIVCYGQSTTKVKYGI